MIAQRARARWLPAKARWALLVLVVGFQIVLGSARTAPAQDTSPPPQVQDFVSLLDDPAVRSWLAQARTAPQGSPPVGGMTDSAQMASRLAGVREHSASVAAAPPRFPAELGLAPGLLLQELRDRGLFAILALIGVFVALGYGSERLFWRATRRARIRMGHHPMARVADRPRMIAMRLGFGVSLVAVFRLGSVGAFLLFNWPPLLRQVVIAYLVAVVLFRLDLVLGRVVLVPGRRRRTGRPGAVQGRADAKWARPLLATPVGAVRGLFRLRARHCRPAWRVRVRAGPVLCRKPLMDRAGRGRQARHIPKGAPGESLSNLHQ